MNEFYQFFHSDFFPQKGRMSVKPSSSKKQIYSPQKKATKSKSNSVHLIVSHNGMKKEKKSVNYHTPTILNQYSKGSRNTSHQNRHSSIGRGCQLKIDHADDMNLMEKLEEISKIRNYNCRRPLLKKGKFRQGQRLMSKDWDYYVQTQKISKSTYESVKSRLMEKKQKEKFTIFTHHNKEKLSYSELQMLATEKPHQFCGFVQGFQDQQKYWRFEPAKSMTRLNVLQQQIKKSETLTKIRSVLGRTGHFERVDNERLNNSFMSAILVLEHINKNGCSDAKTKQMLKKAECTL